MQKDEIFSLCRSFLESYDPEKRDVSWQSNSW